MILNLYWSNKPTNPSIDSLTNSPKSFPFCVLDLVRVIEESCVLRVDLWDPKNEEPVPPAAYIGDICSPRRIWLSGLDKFPGTHRLWKSSNSVLIDGWRALRIPPEVNSCSDYFFCFIFQAYNLKLLSDALCPRRLFMLFTVFLAGLTSKKLLLDLLRIEFGLPSPDSNSSLSKILLPVGSGAFIKPSLILSFLSLTMLW